MAARITSILFQAKVLKRPLLKYMDVSIDYACNMKCVHCFQGTWKREGTKLSLEDYERIAEEAMSIGVLHVNIQGGEPLLIKSFPDIARVFTKRNIWVSITTNAYLITSEWVQKLKEIGVRQMVCSLDSMDAESHDEFRRCEGSHARVLEAIKSARKSGLGVSINVTVSRQSFDDPKQIALFEWLRENQIAYNPIIATPTGDWSGNYDAMMTEEQMKELKRRTDEDGLGVRDLSASWVHEGCPAVIEQIYLTPYGDIMPCPFIHISMGNVHDRSLADIWRQAVSEKLHGGYDDKCWIGENREFAEAMNEVTGNGEALPVSLDKPGVRETLERFWNPDAARTHQEAKKHQKNSRVISLPIVEAPVAAGKATPGNGRTASINEIVEHADEHEQQLCTDTLR